MKEYAETVTHLKSLNIHPGRYKETVFLESFDGLPRQKEFEELYDYMTHFLENHIDKELLPKAYVAFNEDRDINAAAIKKDNLGVIIFCQGMVVRLFEMFAKNENDLNTDPFFSDYRALLQSSGTTISEFMFQNVCGFFFYHELGHLFQLSAGSEYIEFADKSFTPEEAFEKQVKEHDADWHASIFLVSHLLRTVGTDGDRDVESTKKELQCAMELSLSAIFAFFVDGLISQNSYKTIYFQESSHPHPVIRLEYILANMLHSIDEEDSLPFELDVEEITSNVKKICKTILQHSKLDMGDMFNAQLKKKEEIFEYILSLKRSNVANRNMSIPRIANTRKR